MAKLDSYFGPHAGNLKIYVGFFSVGQGAFKHFDQFEAAFNGSYNAFGQSGTFDIQLALTDKNPAAQNGLLHHHVERQDRQRREI